MSASEWAAVLTAIAAVITAWAEHRVKRSQLEIDAVRLDVRYLAERVAKLEGKAGV